MDNFNYDNRFSIKIKTEPAIEPVSVEEVKIHSRISGSDQDSQIAKWIKSARTLAEIYQRRAYIAQTIELSFDSFPLTPFCLPRSPISEVTEIKYYDVNNLEVIVYNTSSPVGTEDNYLIDIDSEPARIMMAYGCAFPTVLLRGISAFKVTYTAGYGETASTTPENVKDAIMLYCDWRFENRSAETNEVPEQFYNLLDIGRIYL